MRTLRTGTAAIRFVADLDPAMGPIGRNVLPGGEVFDPASPHYRDLYALWAQNQTVELAFQAHDVVQRASVEAATHGIGRRQFAP